MNSYDPSIDPDPNSWLQADESQRISFIEAFHRAEGIELPNETAHAAIHAIVENQIALGVSAVVEAMARLQGEGLERHEAVHAVGTVLAEVLHSLMRSNGSPDPDSSNAKYEKALKKLTVAWWHRNYG